MTHLTKFLISITLIAGTLDIALAFLESYLISNTKPEIVLKFIASGIFGAKAFQPGLLFTLVGLLLHYLITLIFTILYFKVNILKQTKKNRPMMSGIVYGTIIWLIMNLVVLPLSHTPSLNRSKWELLLSLIIQIIAIGLPIAIGYSKYQNKIKVN